MNTREARRLLVGRRIVRVTMNAFRDAHGTWVHDPVIELDDGTRIAFVAEHAEGDEASGVDMVIVVRKEGAR